MGNPCTFLYKHDKDTTKAFLLHIDTNLILFVMYLNWKQS